MVLDCTVAELNGRIAESPITINAYTLEQLRQAKALDQPKQKDVGGKLSKWLGQRERDKPFQQFLQKKYGRNATDPKTAEIAVKDIVGFASLIQLDNDVELGMKFKKMIMLEFNSWLNR
jgi:hypothetical protein